MAMVAVSVWDQCYGMWPLAQDRHYSLYPVGTGRTIFGRAMDVLRARECPNCIVVALAQDAERMRSEIPAGMCAEVIHPGDAQALGEREEVTLESILQIPPLQYPWDLLRYHLELMQAVEAHDPGLKRRIEDFRWSICGNVHIEEDVYVAASAIVRGPCVLKRGAEIHDRAVVRGSYIGEGVVVGTGATVKNSIVYEQSKLRHGAIILHSIVGERCNIGPGTTTSDVRLDRQDVQSAIQGLQVSTGLRCFGTVLGADTATGTSVSIRAGVKIGRGCRLYGGICVTKDIQDHMEVDFKESPLEFKKID